MKKKQFFATLVVLAVLIPSLAFGSSLFYVDNVGNVGIGNSTPTHKLDVSGSIYSRLVTATDSSSTTIDWSSGNVQSLTLSVATTTLTFSNAQAGGEYKLIVNQDATGGKALVWPSGIKWSGGTQPTLTVTASATDLVSFVFDGTNYLATSVLNLKSPPGTTFSDSFTRSDSTTIGNSWTEGLDGSGADFAISSNQLKMTGNQNGASFAYHDAGGSMAVGAKFTTTFTPTDWTDTGGTQMLLLMLSNGSSKNGFGIHAIPDSNAITIVDNSTVKASGTYSFSSGGGTSYYVELLRTTNGMETRIWATGGSRPSSPTLSYDAGSTYTPSASGSNIQIYAGEQSVGNKVLIFDDPTVVQ